MQEIPHEDSAPAKKKPSWFTRVSMVTSAGLLATLLAAGFGGAASAQTVIDDGAPPAEAIVESSDRVVVERAAQPGDDLEGEMFEFSAEDDAVWEQFEQCLADAGLTEDDFDESDGSTPDEATIDAAFERCDPILDGLSDEVILGEFGEFAELSEADEAVFDQYDECLDAGGIDALFEGEDVEGAEFDEAAIDALFEQCDPILESLSEDAQELFGEFEDFAELSEADEAVFDQYDECLDAGGIDALFEGEDVEGAEFDEAAIDALFEQCDPILENLSDEAQELFGDCPEDDDHLEGEGPDA